MFASARTLDALFSEGILDLERSPLFETTPTIPTGAVPWERVEGMLLGLAVGDALGTTCEGSAPAARGTLHGEVRDYVPSLFSGNLPYGLPSDDTQLAYWTLECLLEDGRVVPDHLLDVFAAGPLYGGGQTLHAALEAWQRGMRPWPRVAQRSAGNGALMRIAPVLLPSLARPSRNLWADTVLAAACTHNDRASTSACLAWVHILWQALQMTRPPAPDWWLDAYVSVARPLEGDSHYVPRYGAWAGSGGPLWQYVAERVADAWGRGLATREACDAWGSGAYLLETVPSVLYILMRHADDPEEALVRAVNDTYDNDTVAAIVGTAVGALHGRNRLPVRWLDGLSGRTRADDSGHVFALLERARWTFGGEPPPYPRSGRPAGPTQAAHVRPTKPGGGLKPPKDRGDAPAVLAGDPPTAPIPMSYWILPGRLLAGEYPSNDDGALARSRLKALLQAGVDLFVDLTEASEPLRPYAAILAEQAAALGRSGEHLRMPVRDVSAPPPAFMADVLDAVDEALATGRCVYVHCGGGIGRTGTMVGCWLVRHGMRADQALARVQALVDTTPKAGTRSPEVPSQEKMVHQWAELDRPTLRERYRGCLLGLACGDALGTTIEFGGRGEKVVTDMVGGGPFRLQPGQWTDDTSMALCLAESLIERQRCDARDQMERYVLWHEQGHLSSTGKCFDIGNTTASALLRYQRTGDPYAGETAADQAGNGSLMRLAPLPMFAMRDARAAFRYAADSSRTTHGAPEAVDACRYFAGLIVGALRGVRKGELLSPRYAPVPGYWQEHRLSPEVDAIAAASYHGKAESEVQTTGYVLHTLEAALWVFARTETFEEGALAAVNLAGDADTTGAVYGQIAGAYYGLNGIPARWRSLLWRADLLTAYADGLYRLATTGMLVS